MQVGAVLALACVLAGCQGLPPEPREVSSAHLGTQTPTAPTAEIPKPVRQTPFVPPPTPSAPKETYTVVVNEVPVKELLFALARDASLNVDIHPDVTGLVTLNAVDQTLDQILTRVSNQLDLRYDISDNGISIRRDTPFVRIYRVDYVNLTREATTSSTVATNIATTESGATTAGGGGGGGGGNNSTTTVTSNSSYPFWETLVETIRSLITGSGANVAGELDAEEAVIANAANGIVMVRATSAQHAEIQSYLDEIQSSSRRQVLIEATIVEVELSDGYSAGVDWSELASDAGVSVQQSLIAGAAAATGQPPFFLLQYADSRDPTTGQPNGDITATVRLLKQFGEAKVLSSPKIMTLNNQTALLKVVENVVYFEVTSSTVSTQAGFDTTSDSTAKSVSVGVVMSVTPQINADDDVILTVRPTISRVADFVDDPNPSLVTPTGERIVNRVPEIAVREMESVLRIGTGQLAVLGGLMQDDIRRDADAVPVLSESETFGELFTSRDNQFVKTELVIFLRPWVIRTPDVRADLHSFQPFLPENIQPSEPVKSRFGRNLP
ncbi:MAG: secretin N-terminal domain-containing protein [Gammaproteobacteria bacterium]|nr:secretin N-terminal domain-containing protein [Gammaproteobacteria bacterium]